MIKKSRLFLLAWMSGKMAKRILYLGLDPCHYKGQGEVTHWPIIQIVPRPISDPAIREALQNFDHYSHIIVTSKSTVAILRNYLPQLGIDLQKWAQKLTLAIGQVTARHLHVCGITPYRIAQEETAEGIIQELQQLPLKNAHIFWPHSAQARAIIKDFLTTQEIPHTTCILYEPKPQVPSTLPDLKDFDEIVLTSPSTVEAFFNIFGSFPSHIHITTIGPITARFLKERQHFHQNLV
jgi:uroporphyrinogen-III synthase